MSQHLAAVLSLLVAGACGHKTGTASPQPDAASAVQAAGGPCSYQHVRGTCRLASVTQLPSDIPGEIGVQATYEVAPDPTSTGGYTLHLSPVTQLLRSYPDRFERDKRFLEEHHEVPCELDVLVKGSCGTPPAVVHIPPQP